MNQTDVIGIFYNKEEDQYIILSKRDIDFSDFTDTVMKAIDKGLGAVFLDNDYNTDYALDWFIPGFIYDTPGNINLSNYLFDNPYTLVVLHRNIDIQLEPTIATCSSTKVTTDNKSSKKKLLI